MAQTIPNLDPTTLADMLRATLAALPHEGDRTDFHARADGHNEWTPEPTAASST